MRGLRHDLRIPATTIAKVLEKRVDPPFVAPADDRLRPKGRNGYVVRDRVTMMKVAPDGTATFKDKRDFTMRLVVPLSVSRDDWDAFHEEVAGACAVGACDTSGNNDEGGGLIGGKADLTAALHRRFVGDPFASRKLKLLDSTRDARVAIGATHRKQQLDRSAELAYRNLEALWRATPDAAARRAALFAMWDECEEGEGARGEAGRRERAVVVGFIRARLPAGSREAFTDREISNLNARRTSRQRFAPYR